MVPKSTHTLLLDLEAIKQVVVEKQSEKLKAKGKAISACPEAKSNPKRKASGGPTGQFHKKGCSEKFCQRCKAQGSPYQTHNTLDCRHYDSNGKPLKAAAGKHQKSHHVPYYIDILINRLGMFNLGIISTFFTLRSYFINLE
jgi:hypothetical protein